MTLYDRITILTGTIAIQAARVKAADKSGMTLVLIAFLGSAKHRRPAHGWKASKHGPKE